MERFLVVAYQTAGSEELAAALREKKSALEETSFVLLVPANEIGSKLKHEQPETEEIFRAIGEEREAMLAASGLEVERVIVSDQPPLEAISKEVERHGSEYHGLIISTFPPGASKWLRLDLVHQLESRFPLPVTHVISDSSQAEGTVTANEVRDEYRAPEGGLNPPMV